MGGALGNTAPSPAAHQPAPVQDATHGDPQDFGQEDSVQIPNAYVGWLKGRQGGKIREIESKSGASVDIDQSMREFGYSVARMRGRLDQKKTARGLIIAEVTKVMEEAGHVEPGFPGTKIEFPINGQYVGWVKGPQGKVVQDLQVRSATRIDVDQKSPQFGFAIVRVFGTSEGCQHAKQLIAAELTKVSPEAAAQINDEVLGTVVKTASQTPQALPVTAAPVLAAPPPQVMLPPGSSLGATLPPLMSPFALRG